MFPLPPQKKPPQLPGQSGRLEKLLTHVHPAPRLRTGGAIPLLPLYTFMGYLHRLVFITLKGNMTSSVPHYTLQQQLRESTW
jgi:hypothetical protein